MAKASLAAHHDLGTLAETYPVKEENALEQIQEKANNAPFPITRERLVSMAQDFKLPTRKLPRAEKDRAFNVWIEHENHQNVANETGRVIYPKGYRHRPLDYVFVLNQYVFIDGTDEDQVRWFNASRYASSPYTVLMITDGRWIDVMRSVNFRVYYALAIITDTFKIKAVPAVVHQVEDHFSVREIRIEKAH